MSFYIEVVRGVPFITVLFMANFMMPLFVPEVLTPDRLLRPMIGTALFSAAYMAEVVRAGLQAIPRGQYEGAQALGVELLHNHAAGDPAAGPDDRYSRHRFDFHRPVQGHDTGRDSRDRRLPAAAETSRIDPGWAGPTISSTVYLFAAIVYWVFCFGMSRYSQSVERHLARTHRS